MSPASPFQAPEAPPAPATPEVGPRTFSAMLGGALLSGFVLATWVSLRAAVLPLPWWVPLLGLPLAYLGTEITARTPSWAGSMLGHLLTMASLGLTASALLTQAALPAVVDMAITLCAGVGVLAGLQILVPALLPVGGLSVPAMVGAWAIARVSHHTAGWLPAGGEWAWGCLTLALLVYIDFWWTSAAARRLTADAAVDTACALYMDPLARLLGYYDRVLPRGR